MGLVEYAQAIFHWQIAIQGNLVTSSYLAKNHKTNTKQNKS